MVSCCDHFLPHRLHSVLQRPSRPCRTNSIRSFLVTNLTDQHSAPVQTGFSSLGRLTIIVPRDKGPFTGFSEDLLEEGNRGLKDLERIVGRKVAAVHVYPRHLHPYKPFVSLQTVPDAQIRATNKDPSPCVVHPGTKQSFRTSFISH